MLLKAVAGAQGTSEDYLGPRKVGPLQRVCPHTPQRQVFRKLPTQACQNCPPALQHTRTQACYFIPGPLSGSSWQGRQGPLRVVNGMGLEALADPQPVGPMCFCLCARVVDFLGTFLVEDRQDLVLQRTWRDKAMQHFAGGLALQRALWLMCYLWRPPDSGLILSLWAGHCAWTKQLQSINQPYGPINQS